ncbi:MAG: S41 family peptidase [Marivibrio sp.]|uniref:S41 family peptidase n=1 Tax=Marivibrio sp. TaxID=2039719 RepID=UPI0032ED929D
MASRAAARLRRAGALSAALLLAACAAGDPDDRLDPGAFERMTEAALEEIDLYYIEPTVPADLVAAGLEGLARFDKTLKVEARDAGVTVRLNETVAGRADAGADDAGDAAAWADKARMLLVAARADSPALAAVEQEALYDAFFDGMLARLDRASRYAGREAAREARAERDGFGGIGVTLEAHPDGARITRVEPDNPAAGAGLLVDDVIVAVEAAPLSGLGLRRIAERLRGPIDRPVTVTIRRAGVAEPITVAVGRTRIVPDTVDLRREDGVAVISVSSFNQRTAKRLAEALASAQAAAGGRREGVILDLRGNPGGLLDQAVDSADLFLEAGLISRADGRHPNSHQRFYAEPGDLAHARPLVILINGASASAAEILAAALQDQGRAAVVGMNSFGKGTIQTVIPLPNDGELYLTWARFVAPSGYPLQRLGVGPTICTSGARDAVRALDEGLAAASAGESPVALRRGLAPKAADADIARVLSACSWIPHEGGDIDMAVARLLLEQPALYERAIALGRWPADT